MAHVLIVDDEKAIRAVLQDFLEDRGFEVTTIGTLADARIFLKGETPDVILLDMTLPDGHGVLFLREVRMREEIKNVPVIMMTAHSSAGDHEEVGRDLGANAFLNKPFDLQELAERIGGLVGKSV